VPTRLFRLKQIKPEHVVRQLPKYKGGEERKFQRDVPSPALPQLRETVVGDLAARVLVGSVIREENVLHVTSEVEVSAIGRLARREMEKGKEKGWEERTKNAPLA
jgi:hypothetical protein